MVFPPISTFILYYSTLRVLVNRLRRKIRYHPNRNHFADRKLFHNPSWNNTHPPKPPAWQFLPAPLPSPTDHSRTKLQLCFYIGAYLIISRPQAESNRFRRKISGNLFPHSKVISHPARVSSRVGKVLVSFLYTGGRTSCIGCGLIPFGVSPTASIIIIP